MSLGARNNTHVYHWHVSTSHYDNRPGLDIAFTAVTPVGNSLELYIDSITKNPPQPSFGGLLPSNPVCDYHEGRRPIWGQIFVRQPTWFWQRWCVCWGRWDGRRGVWSWPIRRRFKQSLYDSWGTHYPVCCITQCAALDFPVTPPRLRGIFISVRRWILTVGADRFYRRLNAMNLTGGHSNTPRLGRQWSPNP